MIGILQDSLSER